MCSLQFIGQGLDERVTSSFLQQGPLENLADVVPVITEISKNLIVNGLNIHNYNVLLLSEALTFYEEVYIQQIMKYIYIQLIKIYHQCISLFLQRSAQWKVAVGYHLGHCHRQRLFTERLLQKVALSYRGFADYY